AVGGEGLRDRVEGGAVAALRDVRDGEQHGPAGYCLYSRSPSWYGSARSRARNVAHSAPIAANAPAAPLTVAATTPSPTAVAVAGATRYATRIRSGRRPGSGSGRLSMSSSTAPG